MGQTVRCPKCKKRFELQEHVDEGDSTWCDYCYEELQVVSVDPPRVGEIRYDSSPNEEEPLGAE